MQDNLYDLGHYSLLMTVYSGTVLAEFAESLDSMLNQTVPPSEIVVVFDGPVSRELESYIVSEVQDLPLKTIRLERNLGPAKAAAEGILECSYELIARLDSDDIAHTDRIEKEIRQFHDNPNLVSVGALVTEFNENGDRYEVKLPERFNDIVAFARRRCPCRQTTLLYRRSKVIAVGNYSSLRVAEEWELYNKFIERGYECYNIQESLVDMRVSDSYFSRRGGMAYAKQILGFKFGMLKKRQCSLSDFIVSGLSSFVVSCLPNKARTAIYAVFLRD